MWEMRQFLVQIHAKMAHLNQPRACMQSGAQQAVRHQHVQRGLGFNQAIVEGIDAHLLPWRLGVAIALIEAKGAGGTQDAAHRLEHVVGDSAAVPKQKEPEQICVRGAARVARGEKGLLGMCALRLLPLPTRAVLGEGICCSCCSNSCCCFRPWGWLVRPQQQAAVIAGKHMLIFLERVEEGPERRLGRAFEGAHEARSPRSAIVEGRVKMIHVAPPWHSRLCGLLVLAVAVAVVVGKGEERADGGREGKKKGGGIVEFGEMRQERKEVRRGGNSSLREARDEMWFQEDSHSPRRCLDDAVSGGQSETNKKKSISD